MEYEEAVRRFAPCGLDCSRCADYARGEIQKLSVRLVELLNGYSRVARVKEDIKPVFAGYPQFEEVLKSFAQAACSGCRGNNVLCPIECVAGVCTREKGVDFCFQCGEFPCSKMIDPPDSGAVAELQPAYEGDRSGGVLPGAKQTTEVLS